MKTYTAEELATVLEAHSAWQAGTGGGQRADLSGSDLRGSNLSGSNLRGCDLSGAYLSGADLSGSDLRGSNLSGSNLRGCDLSGAYLRGCDLSGAYLRGCDLSGAYLSGADLSGSDLRGSNLSGSNLSGSDLRGSNLSGSNGEKFKVQTARIITGLYKYEVWSVVDEDGEPWVRMGCLFYSVSKWAEIGIRNSNLAEYPDNGSERCEERVAAFEFARAMAVRLALQVTKQEPTP
jgi:hypothetical protein